MTKNKSIFIAVAVFSLAIFVQADESKLKEHQLDTKLRLIHFDRDFKNEKNDKQQTAAGLELNYISPQILNLVSIGLSGYFVEDLDDSGEKREDILTLDDDELDGFALLGQAYVDITPGGGFFLKIGRMKHSSLLLKSSGSRAVPDTYQGVAAQFNINENFSLYTAIYDKWSRRTRDNFEGFATDQSNQGTIDYVSIVGANYKFNKFKFEIEHLKSKDYLSKFGLRGTYLLALDSSELKFTGGIFTSSDDGSLFVTSSEGGDLDDENVDGSEEGVTRSDNDGLGGYVDANWTKDNATFSLAIAKFDDSWLEDNFAGDHGTNPFPTRSFVGPDLSNTNETVVRVELTYDWKRYIPGLKTWLAAGFGSDAENSVSASLGTADEDWKEIRFKYEFPTIKGLLLSGSWHDYDSDVVGQVDGVKQDETDVRVYLDYNYSF